MQLQKSLHTSLRFLKTLYYWANRLADLSIRSNPKYRKNNIEQEFIDRRNKTFQIVHGSLFIIFLLETLITREMALSTQTFKASITKMEYDLLNPTFEQEKQKNKLKRLVQSPNSYFMDVKCPGCYSVATVYSHAQNVVICEGCTQVLAKPTGGKCKLEVGTSYRVKADSQAK